MKLNQKAVELAMARKAINLSEFVALANITPMAYYNGLKGKMQPKTLGKIARALEVEPEDIIVNEEV